MTGYGIGEAFAEGQAITAEIRSVNNRYLDLNIRMPRSLYRHESKLKDLIRSKIQRGRVSIYLNETRDTGFVPDIKVDYGKIEAYLKVLTEIKAKFKLPGEVDLSQLLKFDDLFVTDESEQHRDQLWKLSVQAVNQALDMFIESCAREGANLIQDLQTRLNLGQQEFQNIIALEQTQIEQYRSRLFQRLEEVSKDHRLDPTRLETELALAADRLDISEEIVRLDSHLKIFQKHLTSSEANGKKLNFILQEMARETNTIASKSWLVEISQAAIRIKEILEQLREQVQNLE